MNRTLASVLALAIAAGTAVAGDPEARSVRLDVRWGSGGGTEAVRDAVERAALQAATVEVCVSEVSADADFQADLVWRIVLIELEEETLYDDTVYGVQIPGEPGKEMDRTVHIRLDLSSQVVAADGSLSDKVRPVRIEESRRPRRPEENTAADLRADAVRRLQRELGKSLCRGAKRLSRAR